MYESVSMCYLFGSMTWFICLFNKPKHTIYFNSRRGNSSILRKPAFLLKNRGNLLNVVQASLYPPPSCASSISLASAIPFSYGCSQIETLLWNFNFSVWRTSGSSSFFSSFFSSSPCFYSIPTVYKAG